MLFPRSTIAILVLSVASSDAFVAPDAFVRSSQLPINSRSHSRTTLQESPTDLHEFDHLLNEQGSGSTGPMPRVSRRVVLPETSMNEIMLTSATSSVTADETETETLLDEAEDMEDFEYEAQSSAIESVEPQSTRMTYAEYQEKVREDPSAKILTFNEYMLAGVLPIILMGLTLRSVVRRTTKRYRNSKRDVLDSYLEDMMYNDGDVDGLKNCKKQYATKLLFLGPARDDIMLKRYMETYARRKTVTPDSLSSMSYVISLFGLSEVQFAKAVVGVCRDLDDDDKASTAGKLLFFGNRILKSPEGLKQLAPARAILKETYSGGGLDGDMMIETSETAMAEAGYRSVIEAKGENQSELTTGWQILGLTKERAQEIFDEEEARGFKSGLEEEWNDRLVKYSDSGEALDEDGNPIKGGGSDENEPAPTQSSQGQIMECQNCGYTIFIAPGRDHKFFGANFKCPECGADKDQMKSAEISEDDF